MSDDEPGGKQPTADPILNYTGAGVRGAIPRLMPGNETRGLQASTSPRLTTEGWAWDRAVKRIAAHGSLAPAEAVASLNVWHNR